VTALVELVEFGALTESQRAELEGDEEDPFDTRGTQLWWRAKDRHVALQDPDGRLIASAGLVLAEIQVDDGGVTPVVGIGGVIVAARCRGRGLANRIIDEALRRASTLGPPLALLFCHRDRAGLYERHRFAEITPPVIVQQPDGFAPIPQVAMWRAIRAGASLPPGQVKLNSLPF
jgi:predicted GNAT family N-acyltransferase